MDAGMVLAFTTGLVGGFGHCIGMCGPLVASAALHASSSSPSPRSLLPRIGPQLLYNSGRVATYTAAGAAMGLAGSFVEVAGRMAGIQHGVMILAGVVMVFMGLGIMGLLGNTRWLERHNSLVLAGAGRLLGRRSVWRYLPLGLVMGLMPCGLSYTVLIGAAGTGSATSGGIMMLCFGAGTVPALGGFGLAVTYLGSTLRGRIQRAGGGLVLLMGLYYLAKGIRLYAHL